MISFVLLTQFALPLALLAWLFLLPAGSLAGFVMQLLGVGAVLLALARVAQWAVPVWWLPWVYAGMWLWALLIWFRLPAGPARENFQLGGTCRFGHRALHWGLVRCARGCGQDPAAGGSGRDRQSVRPGAFSCRARRLQHVAEWLPENT